MAERKNNDKIRKIRAKVGAVIQDNMEMLKKMDNLRMEKVEILYIYKRNKVINIDIGDDVSKFEILGILETYIKELKKDLEYGWHDDER